jgi:hypothetical protein
MNVAVDRCTAYSWSTRLEINYLFPTREDNVTIEWGQL